MSLFFSEIASSQELADRVGDRRWVELLRDHNAIVRELVARHGGFEVNFHGDGFTLAFGTPAAALRCALDVRRALGEHAAAHPGEELRPRIGLHHVASGQVAGRHVLLASRIAERADAGEILASAALRDALEGADGVTFTATATAAEDDAGALHPLFGVRAAAETGRHEIHARRLYRRPRLAAAVA